ncbi:MAG TPA: hypothetical protein VIH57_03090 [Bacteroidales bacterium]
MKHVSNLWWAGIFILPLMFTECSKSTDSPSTGNNNYVAPTLAKDTLVKIPDRMQTKAESGSDYNLTLGVTQINFVNAFTTTLSGAFFYDQTTIDGWQSSGNSDGSTSYTWQYLQYKIKLTYYHSESESWWKYEEDSASYSYPLYYVDDKGTSGEIDWYGQENFKSPSVLIYKDVWTISNNVKNSTFTIYNSDGTTVNTKYVTVSNADKSGTLKVYSLNGSHQLVQQWYYVWDKTGAGSYTNYQSDGTTVNFTGTF